MRFAGGGTSAAGCIVADGILLSAYDFYVDRRQAMSI